MATDPLTEVLTVFEAMLTEPPDLGIRLANYLPGPTVDPAQRQNGAVALTRRSTINTEESRDQDSERVEDIIVVELSTAVTPHDQRTSRDEAHDTQDTIRNRLTDLTETRIAPWHPTHVDTTERFVGGAGEWIVQTMLLQVRRDQTIGGG